MNKLIKYFIRKTSIGVASLAIASMFVAQANAQEVQTQIAETTSTTTEFAQELNPPVASTEIVEAQMSSSEPVFNQAQAAPAETTVQNIVVNEADSSDDQGGPDWVELYNPSLEDKDISGYYLMDKKDREVGVDTTPFPDNTIIKQNGYYVAEEGKDFTFGLGKEDSVRLFDKLGNLISELSWTGGHAQGSYGYPEDGTGEISDITSSKGESNSTPNKDENALKINEVDSAPEDWIELINKGTANLDISGFEVRDDSDDHRFKFADNTIIKANDFFVIDKNYIGLNYDNTTQNYTSGAMSFGLGGSDKVRLFDKAGNMIDQISWTEHASYIGDEAKATLGRVPGTDDIIQTMQPTPAQENKLFAPSVWINEVETNDPNDGPDWVEFFNETDDTVNLKGLTLKDNDDSHGYIFGDFEIAANTYKIITDEIFGFGLGKTDSVRLFNGNELLQEVTWENGHAAQTFGRMEDGSYKDTSKPTPEAVNEFAELESKPWMGSENVTIFDETATFLEDSSGLDFHESSLYAVDNGEGIFWKLDLDENNQLSIADGWLDGKRVRFQKDSDNLDAKGPDTEGITLNKEGMVYIAAERDNSEKAVNFNVVLKVDPTQAGTDLVSLQEWDLTPLLPEVSANMGIEAIEFVESANLIGKLFDINTKALYDPQTYKDAESDGLFFVALEDNGHVYGFNLNKDGSANLIIDIDTGVGGAMALDYEKNTQTLWVSTDNGYEGVLSQVIFNGTESPDVYHVDKPIGLETDNHEGFAIATSDFTKDGIKPVFWITDGLKEKALKVGQILSIEAIDTETLEKTISPEVPETEEDKNSNNEKTDSNNKSSNTSSSKKELYISESSDELPQTGESNLIFNVAATSILLGLGLLPTVSTKLKQ